MDFFKSVFADDTEDTFTSPSNSQSPNPNPNIPSVTNAWTFGSSLFRTIASKSESVIQNYRRDLEDFSSGLKIETATIREVASRAVKDLPARLESGAAVAQESLESVGQAIDNIAEIIAHGKDSILVNDSDSELSESSNRSSARSGSLDQNAKPYSRIDAINRAIQCDAKTYCEKPEDLSDYNEWRLGFVLEDKSGEVEDLIKENDVIGEIYSEVVPSRVDEETFWCRYFYKVYRIRKAEEARARLVKRAISGEEEEELSWDTDDEDNDDVEGSSRIASENVGIEEMEKKMDSLQVDVGTRSEGIEEMEKKMDSLQVDVGTRSEGGDEKGILFDAESRLDREGKNDNSDFSVISSQPSSHEGDDLDWDEIEDVASGDESKLSERLSSSKAELRKRLNAAEEEEEEESIWDIEDDDEAA